MNDAGRPVRRYGALALGITLMVPLGCNAPEEPSADPGSICNQNSVCEPGEILHGCASECVRDATLTHSLDECTKQMSTESIERELWLGISFASSLRSALGEAGRLGYAIASDFRGVLTELAYHPNEDVLSVPFSFDGAGLYRADLAVLGQGSVEARFFFGADYEAGKPGAPILPYLFRAEAYVINPVVDLMSGDATVSYTDEGPLVELLGFGLNPPNPFTLGLFSASNETTKQQIELISTVDEEDTKGVRSRYRTRLSRAVGLFYKAVAPIHLMEASAARADTAQTLSISVWQLAYDFGPGTEYMTLKGTLGFEVQGGAIKYKGTVLFHSLSHVEIALTCVP